MSVCLSARLQINKKIFSEFDTYIQKAKKQILDTRNHTAIKNVASELKDVHKIMGIKNNLKIFLK